MTEAGLLDAPTREEFAEGARAAVRDCLRVLPSETVTLITDETTREIAASLARELDAVGCSWRAFLLEELAPRPLTAMPGEVLASLEVSDVSIFAVQVQPNELRSRMQ